MKSLSATLRGIILPRNTFVADKKASLRYFWIMFFVYVYIYMTKQTFSAAMAAIVAEGVLTKSQTGTIVAVFYLLYAPLQIFGGVLADRYNPETLIVVGLLGSGAINVVLFLNQNYYVMLIMWGLNAVFQFPLYPALFKIISSGIAAEVRPKAMFYFNLASYFGLILSFFVGAIVTVWQYNFFIASAILFGSTLLFFIGAKRKEKYAVPIENAQKEKSSNDGQENLKTGRSTFKLFLISGFMLFIPAVLLRGVLENGIKSVSPTMLSESYANISPSIGNLMNILIIISGTIGMTIVRSFALNRWKDNEAVGVLILYGLSIPFVAFLIMIGTIPIWLALVSLCMISALLSPAHMLLTFASMKFAKFGKSGTAAGLINAAASVSIMLLNYVFLKLADGWGWEAVNIAFTVMMIISLVFVFCAIKKWKRFTHFRIFGHKKHLKI